MCGIVLYLLYTRPPRLPPPKIRIHEPANALCASSEVGRVIDVTEFRIQFTLGRAKTFMSTLCDNDMLRDIQERVEVPPGLGPAPVWYGGTSKLPTLPRLALSIPLCSVTCNTYCGNTGHVPLCSRLGAVGWSWNNAGRRQLWHRGPPGWRSCFLDLAIFRYGP